jgi:two-component system, sensor histidine kinase
MAIREGQELDTKAAIAAEQVFYVRRNLLLSGPPSVFAIWLVFIVFREHGNAVGMAIWAALFTLGVCWTHTAGMKPRVVDASNAQDWLRRIPPRMFITNIALGSGAFLLIPGFPVGHQVTYLFVVFALCASSVICYGPHYRLLVATIVPIIIPATVVLFMQGTLLHTGLAIGQIILLGLALYFGHNFALVYRRNLELRFENMQLVRELTAQKEAAESANLSKSRFLASASHDLRQPMHALNLYLGALSGAEMAPSSKPLLANAQECAEAMDDMFRALLDVSSLDAGAVKPDWTVFPIATVLERMRLSYGPAAHERDLVLRVVSSSAWVHGDPAIVERIVGNLVSNAVRYTPHGKVLLGCRRRGERLEIAVYDTGLGIDEDKQALIFEEFYQVENEERDRKQGLGLGLAIVHRLARLLDANIWLRSQFGRGSVFSFDLKIAQVQSAEGLQDARRGPGLAKLVDALVVIVDDERMILDATRAVLERNGSFVFAAGSGDEALRWLAHSRRVPDLLICDHRLRAGETGIQVIERIREEFNKQIPALLITGDTAPERIRDMQSTGLPILHKPIQERDLLRAAAKLLSDDAPRESIAA